MILHLSQIFLTDARTFMSVSFFTYPVQLFPEQLYNPASSPVMRRDRHQNPVARPEPDKIRFRRPSHMRQDPVLISQPQPERRARKELNHFSFYFHRRFRWLP